MSCGKRLAKRSIVGTRVCAPLDRHYFSGIIKATKTSSVDTRDTLYSVLFDQPFNSRKVTLDYSAKQLIGPGFQSVSTAHLNAGQKIYLTYNGREVSGVVDSHNLTNDEVFLVIDNASNNTTNNTNNNSLINQNAIKVKRRLEEVRLLESRKSARLQEVDTDYRALDGQTEQLRRRTSSMSSSVSNSSMSSHIDVPNVHNGRKRRPSNSEDDVMDDCMAAMVLMSLSCSPKSPRLPELIIYKCTWPGCLYQNEHCQQIEKHVRTQHLGRTDLNGESSDREEEFYYTEVPVNETDENSVGSSSSNSSLSHSVPQSPSISNDGSLTGSQSPTPSPQTHIFFAQTSCSAPTFSHLEDHEYEKRRDKSELDHKIIKFTNDLNSMNGIHINVNNNCNLKANGNTNHININNNSNTGLKSKQKSLLSTTPINIPGMSTLSSAYRPHQYATSAPQQPVSIQSPRVNHKYMRLNSNNNCVSNGSANAINGLTIGTTLLQTSANKTSPSKRGRGESRKCRKVYGMDSRESWCTQCKWKKACTRFTD